MVFDDSFDPPMFTKEVMRIPCFSELKMGAVDAKEFREWQTYLYFMYSVNTPYFEVLMTDRRKLVIEDHLKKSFDGIKFEKHNSVIKVIERIKQLEYTTKQRYIDGWNVRVDQIIQLWNKKKLTNANVDDETKNMKSIKDMLILRKSIEDLQDDKRLTEAYGGGEDALFENP